MFYGLMPEIKVDWIGLDKSVQINAVKWTDKWTDIQRHTDTKTVCLCLCLSADTDRQTYRQTDKISATDLHMNFLYNSL